jgi:type I restriction enzyme S subunit
MSLTRYPDYKRSGVEWLGSVPSHWTIGPLKHFYSITGGSTPKSDVETYWDGSIVWVTPADLSKIYGFEIKESERRITEKGLDSCGTSLVPVGSVVLATRAPIGTLGIAATPLCTNQGCKSLTPHVNQNSKFLAYVLSISTEALNVRGRGTTFLELSADELGAFKLPFPNKDEQDVIVKFLDYETEKIDNLIAEQKKIINLLKSKLDSLVLESFDNLDTKLIRIKNAVEVIDRPVIQDDSQIYEPLGLFNRGRGLFHKEKRATADMGDSDFYWIKEGDLILSGQFAWEGSVALAYKEEEGCVVSHRYPVIRGKMNITLTEYLFALLTTDHGNFLLNQSSVGAAGRNRPLNINLLLKEVIPVPNIKTQEKIAGIVVERRNLLREIHEQTKLINERRSALISAAVTGQIDVRNYQPKEVA